MVYLWVIADYKHIDKILNSKKNNKMIVNAERVFNSVIHIVQYYHNNTIILTITSLL